jgi:hypothetical protein
MTISRLLFRRSALSGAALFAISLSAGVSAATLPVGPGKSFSSPCQAFAVAVDGDTVEIDGAGSYDGDVCPIRPSNLTIRGVNGRPKINANGQNSLGKGTWVVMGSGTTIENVEMFGARVPDQNGAAIRLDGRDLTLRNSYLHHNENGILTSNDGVSNVVIENSEFSDNGLGTGYTHNVYIGDINSLVFRGSYSHDANVGHNLKSRAATNIIVYSRFSSTYAQPSYEIDLPSAGTSYVIGNVIQQPAANQAATMLAYGEEGASNPGHDLYVVNNTFLNDDSVRGTFVMVGDSVGTPALLQNNIFSGTGNATNQVNAIDRNNYRSLSPSFVDRSAYDLHPLAGSAMVDAGAAVGSAPSGMSLAPTEQYRFPVGTEPRPTSGAIDIGAYESTNLLSTTAGVVEAIVAPLATTTVAPETSATSWTQCAAEYSVCYFSGTRQVRYGLNGIYAYKSATDSIACNNETFGDPVYGFDKICEYAQ